MQNLPMDNFDSFGYGLRALYLPYIIDIIIENKIMTIVRIIISLVFLVAIGLGVWGVNYMHPELSHNVTDAELPPSAAIGGSFKLTDQNSHTVKDSDFHGRLMLVFFGYTHCPDECPLAAGNMSAAMSMLGTKADSVAPIFISVDAKRDTPKALAGFLSALDKRFVGLTGTSVQLKQVADEYKVYAQPHEQGETIDHSAFIYLMDRDGHYLTHFPNDASAKELADGLKKQL